MDVLARIVACIFLANVAAVVFLALADRVRDRRDQREVRALELLYRAPSASHTEDGDRPESRRGRDHLVVALRDRERDASVRSTSMIVAALSIAVVTGAATLLGPGDIATTRGSGAATASVAEAEGERPSFPAQRVDSAATTEEGIGRYGPTDPLQERGGNDDPDGVGAPGRNVVVSAGQESVPAVVTAKPTSPSAIHIDWVPVPAATGYRVDRWADGASHTGGGWATIAKTVSGFSSYTDTGLDAASTYYYRVAAVLIGGESAPASDVVHATTLSPRPQAPTLTAQAVGDAIVLGWSDVEGETGYRIERLAIGATEWTMIGTSAEGVVTVRDGNVSAGVTYRYRVIATGVGGDSEPSNVVSVEAPTPVVEGTSPSAEDPQDGGSAPEPSESDTQVSG